MLDLRKNDPCPECGRFDNRGLSIDAVIIKNGKVLLVKRGVEPFKGFWATPGGYVNWDETVEETVRREVFEETNLKVIKLRLVGVYSSPKRHPKQVVNLVYSVEANGELSPKDDATEALWFPLESLPEKMAFDHRQNIKDAKNTFLASF